MFIPFLLQEETKEHLFKDIIKKYLNVGTKQFLKNFRHDRSLKKTAAHRQMVMMRKEKKETRGAKVTIKQAYEDKSRGKSFTHQKLQVFLTKYGENALCENYTRAELTILCAAYGSECKTRIKKLKWEENLHSKLTGCNVFLIHTCSLITGTHKQNTRQMQIVQNRA